MGAAHVNGAGKVPASMLPEKCSLHCSFSDWSTGLFNLY